MKNRLFKALATSAVLALGASTAATAAECIAPANPGGDWDFTCRQIGKIMFDIGAVDKPVQVTNMPGAGGGLAGDDTVFDGPELWIAVPTRQVLTVEKGFGFVVISEGAGSDEEQACEQGDGKQETFHN